MCHGVRQGVSRQQRARGSVCLRERESRRHLVLRGCCSCMLQWVAPVCRCSRALCSWRQSARAGPDHTLGKWTTAVAQPAGLGPRVAPAPRLAPATACNTASRVTHTASLADARTGRAGHCECCADRADHSWCKLKLRGYTQPLYCKASEHEHADSRALKEVEAKRTWVVEWLPHTQTRLTEV